MNEANENNFYTLLVGISKEVGETNSSIAGIQEAIKELKVTVEKNNRESMNSDKKNSEKLEEYKEQLQEELNIHNKRITALENSHKNKLWNLFERFKGLLITAIITAMVAFCMKFMSDLIKTLKTPPEHERIEKTEVK